MTNAGMDVDKLEALCTGRNAEWFSCYGCPLRKFKMKLHVIQQVYFWVYYSIEKEIKDLHTLFPISIIHNGQEVGAAQMSTDEWMDR